MSERNLPYVLSGFGLLLGAVVVGGFGYVLFARGLTPDAIVTYASSLPFAVLLVAGGLWLPRSDVSPEHYRRIGLWTAAGTAFLTSLFAVIALVTQDDWVVRIAMIGWAASTGGGAGLLIGVFEVRAVERAVAAERARVRNEELRRQNERLDELASIISHDLRNPLTVAQSYVDLLREDIDAAERTERLETVARTLERMERIVEETLTLARSGRVIDDPEPVAIAAHARQCWENVSTADATLTVESSTVVVADPSRLAHLFENLFRNAVEHGGDDVTVRVGALADGDGFYVADDGPGVGPEERDVVFEPGYSSSETGSGFGLAIVTQIVDAHGWEIRLTDADGEGARFEISGVETLPSLEADASAARTRASFTN
ncbi:ATP-binding protein [Halarchaeum sp. P4]|uniref:ATP-binding protein n=1 Tax=Halarchaeum sp. P4 TaxID=3421639 RepID=UPI003EB75DE1